MKYKVKDITDEGLEVRLPVAAEWLQAHCPDLDVRLAAEGLALTGRLEASGGDSFLLRGDLRGTLLTTCARCLEEARLVMDAPMTLTFIERESPDAPVLEEDESEAMEGSEVVPFSGREIDLGPGIRDEIVLALPIGPICRDDCAGLCSICGGNRNAVACDCEAQRRGADSPWSVLEKLKSPD